MIKNPIDLGAFQLIKESDLIEEPGQAPGRITLCYSKSSGTYVTHYHNTQDNGLYSGHYFDTLVDAEKDFKARVAKKW